VNGGCQRSVCRDVLRASLLTILLLTALPHGVAAAQPDAAALAHAQDLFTRGVAAYDAGRLDEAAQLLGEADTILPSPELAFNIGRVYERMGEAAQAIRYFERYVHDGHPTDAERADITTRIAALRALDQRHHDQIMTAPPSTDDMTAEARTFFLRGVTMFRRHQYDAARMAFTAAYRFAPLPEVIYNLAVLSERTGQRQDAIDYYREYLRVRPTDPDRVAIERQIETLRSSH
jgi:tetratricopeptide (TPR) repeat protein